MSSIADDSSIGDSVSSVGPDGWEAVERLQGDDSDDSAFSRVPTPVVDELQQSAMLNRSHLIDDAADINDVDSPETVAPLPAIDDEKESDISILSESGEIMFDEKDDGLGREHQQDVTCSFADIRGTTAQSFLETSSTWSHLDKVHGSLKMKLAPKPLALDRPLRLFYVGPTQNQGEVEAKIGSALYAGADEVPSPRRRNIMPVSLDKESPEVALVPDSGMKMDIETCLHAQYAPDDRESMIVTMDSGSVFRSSYDSDARRFIVTGKANLPDLAIIQIPEDDAQEKSLRFRARLFLNRHGIPTIIVSSSRQWQAPNRPLTIDVRSPHFVMHVPGATTSESAVLRRLPVDLNTFVSINSLQLNRSLACMLENSPTYGRKPASQSISGRSDYKQLRNLPLLRHILSLLAAVFAILAIGGLFMGHPAFVPLEANELAYISSTVHAPALTHTLTTSVAAPVVAPVSTVSKSLSVRQENALVHVPETAEFEVEVLGDSVILVKPPRWILEGKRPPKLKFAVYKDDRELDIKLSTISNTRVFALNLPWESAYGNVRIHIVGSAGTTKIDQFESVDFGSSYWKLWFRQKKTSELFEEQQMDSKKDQQSQSKPRDRLADDIQAAGNTAARFGRRWANVIKAGLVSNTDERLRIRQKKRSMREERIKEILKTVSQRKDEAADVVSKEVRELIKFVNEFKRTHFREQQKDLLKLWWRVSGGPTEEVRKGDGSAKSKPKKVARQSVG